jgi:hypothetical protein
MKWPPPADVSLAGYITFFRPEGAREIFWWGINRSSREEVAVLPLHGPRLEADIGRKDVPDKDTWHYVNYS